jgi:hypothetical protein
MNKFFFKLNENFRGRYSCHDCPLNRVEDLIGASTLYKKVNRFPSLAVMSLIKLSLAGNNLMIPVQGEFGQ